MDSFATKIPSGALRLTRTRNTQIVAGGKITEITKLFMSNPEGMSFQPEISESKKEFPPNKKRKLSEVWANVVLGVNEVNEQNVEGLSFIELRNLLNKQLLQETDNLLEEWHVLANESLIEKIQQEEDKTKKAKLELDYIKQIHQQIDQLVQGFDHSESKSTKWDSWPDRMRENKEFNCVGAMLLGSALLEKAGIQQFTGNPPSHVVNIVHLSNDDWWFVDFMNGKNNVQQIKPIEREIAGHRVLEINHPTIDYRLIPITPKEEIGTYIIGNLATLQRDAYDAKHETQIDDVEVKEAVEYAKRHDLLQMDDLSEYGAYLFPTNTHINNTPEMKAESARIKRVYEIDNISKDAITGLSKEQIIAMTKEISQKESEIREFFYNDTESILTRITPELKKFLETYRAGLADLKKKQREEYEEAIERMLKKITSFTRVE